MTKEEVVEVREAERVITMEEDGRLGNLLMEMATLLLIGRQANVNVSLLPQVSIPYSQSNIWGNVQNSDSVSYWLVDLQSPQKINKVLCQSTKACIEGKWKQTRPLTKLLLHYKTGQVKTHKATWSADKLVTHLGFLCIDHRVSEMIITQISEKDRAK